LDNYFQLRKTIHSKLVILKKRYGVSQSDIALMATEKTTVNFYPKDVNALNNLQNKTKWKGTTKREKLESFFSAVQQIEKEQIEIHDKPCLELEKELNVLINKAVQAEFLAYQTLPNISAAKKLLTPYFTRTGNALKIICGILERNKKRNWILSDSNPSTTRLINSKVIEINNDNAIVATKEYWLLVWINSLSKTIDYIYEKEDEQKYILVKNKKTGLFEIDINSYESINKKVLPRIFQEGDFDDVLQKDSQEIAKTIRQVISIGGFDAALQILSQYSLQTGVQDISEEVLTIKSTFSDYTRLLNIEKISQEDYYNKKSELVASILKIVEKFG